MVMKTRNKKQKDKRFSLFLSAVDREIAPPDEDFLNELQEKTTTRFLASSAKSKTQMTIIPSEWRIIMNKPITKLATAAAVILIAVLAITFLDKAATPAWAIEQTIDLLKNFDAMHVTGTMLDEEGKEVTFEAWARANEDQTGSNHLRIVTGTGEIDVVSGDQRYQYNPATKIVKLTEGYGQAIGIWFGADFFESLKKIMLDWNETYGKDPATNRDRVFVTCCHPAAPNPRSFWCEFDVESKLPVSFKQWENMKREGTPSFYVKTIKYLDDLPDEMFDFKIPEGAKVVPALTERNEKLKDPNSGMPLGDMTEDQSSMEITRRYWQAVIEGDWQTVAMLYPVSTAQQWETKYKGSNFEEIIEIKEPYQAEGYMVAPCVIKFSDNSYITINMAVWFRKIDGCRSCVIVNTWSQDWVKPQI
jgi:hypothetical protein